MESAWAAKSTPDARGTKRSTHKESEMSSARQRAAARRNIRKAATAARRTRTIAHLPKATRTALGKQASSVRKRNARRRKSAR
jgi:hypothetical protein